MGLNHPLTHGGLYTVGNFSVLVEGTLNCTDEIIVRDAIPREEKKRQYQRHENDILYARCSNRTPRRIVSSTSTPVSRIGALLPKCAKVLEYERVHCGYY